MVSICPDILMKTIADNSLRLTGYNSDKISLYVFLPCKDSFLDVIAALNSTTAIEDIFLNMEDCKHIDSKGKSSLSKILEIQGKSTMSDIMIKILNKGNTKFILT